MFEGLRRRLRHAYIWINRIVAGAEVPARPIGSTERIRIDPITVTRIEERTREDLPSETQHWTTPTRVLFHTGNAIVVTESGDELSAELNKYMPERTPAW